jgi:hypothetical protein
MRPLTYQDVATTARALSMVPADQRGSELERILEDAMTADSFRKRYGCWHGRFGNGSLEAAARLRPVGTYLQFDNPEHLTCLTLVLDRLAALRSCSSQVTSPP